MKIETVQIGNAWYVVKNGVMGTPFAAQVEDMWGVFIPAIAYRVNTKAQALALVADQIDDWYTATEAAERLVEMGVCDKAPSAHDVCMWARNGLLPGAVKIPAPGQGGSWRIPESALEALAERRGQ